MGAGPVAPPPLSRQPPRVQCKPQQHSCVHANLLLQLPGTPSPRLIKWLIRYSAPAIGSYTHGTPALRATSLMSAIMPCGAIPPQPSWSSTREPAALRSIDKRVTTLSRRRFTYLAKAVLVWHMVQQAEGVDRAPPATHSNWMCTRARPSHGCLPRHALCYG